MTAGRLCLPHLPSKVRMKLCERTRTTFCPCAERFESQRPATDRLPLPLSLQYHSQSALPATIATFMQLGRLVMAQNRLTALPSEIGHLLSLRVLDLRCNVLRALPDELGGLVKLEKLLLAQNELWALPTSVRRSPLALSKSSCCLVNTSQRDCLLGPLRRSQRVATPWKGSKRKPLAWIARLSKRTL